MSESLGVRDATQSIALQPTDRFPEQPARLAQQSKAVASDPAIPSPELLAAFRRRVFEVARRGVARDRARARERRTRVMSALRDAVAAARHEGVCRRVWLFGSYAWGQPQGRSDVDLLLEGATDLMEVAGRISAAIGLDVHAIALETAPPELVERAMTEGIEL